MNYEHIHHIPLHGLNGVTHKIWTEQTPAHFRSFDGLTPQSIMTSSTPSAARHLTHLFHRRGVGVDLESCPHNALAAAED